MFKRVKIRDKLFCWIGMGVIFFSPNLFGQDISVSPSILDFTGNPGEIVSKSVTLTNMGSKTYDFKVHLKDWERDSLGNKLYMEEGSLANSNTLWVKLAENSFSLAPAARKQVLVNLEIPAGINAHTASNSMLFFTQTNPDKAASNLSAIGVQVSYEFGVQLFYNPNGLLKGEINYNKMFFQPAQDALCPKISIHFTNTGQVNKRGTIRLELTNKQAGQEHKLAPIPFAIMPLGQQVMWIDLPKNLAKGEYHVVTLLDAGNEYDLKVAEKEIYVD